jgi:acyl carrier protein
MTDIDANAIRAFIVENFLFGDSTYPIDDNTSLIENHLVDSTGVLELVAFVEDYFGITVADAEIVPANLDSIGSLCAYITKKVNAGTAAA